MLPSMNQTAHQSPPSYPNPTTTLISNDAYYVVPHPIACAVSHFPLTTHAVHAHVPSPHLATPPPILPSCYIASTIATLINRNHCLRSNNQITNSIPLSITAHSTIRITFMSHKYPSGSLSSSLHLLTPPFYRTSSGPGASAMQSNISTFQFQLSFHSSTHTFATNHTAHAGAAVVRNASGDSYVQAHVIATTRHASYDSLSHLRGQVASLFLISLTQRLASSA